MLHKAKRYASNHPIEEELNPDEATAPKRSLPKDVAFDDTTSTLPAGFTQSPTQPTTNSTNPNAATNSQTVNNPGNTTSAYTRDTQNIAPRFGAEQEQDYRF